MIRLANVCVAVILIAGSTPGPEAVVFKSCPRPTDQYGPRYGILTGAYQSRGVSPGGGKFVTLMADNRAAAISVSVNDEVFEDAGTLAIGTRITLLRYVSNSMSGAQPPYSCIELAR
jgi:hypothetical protein